MQRLKLFYETNVIPLMLASFNYKNINQVPKLLKITLNRSFDESCQTQKTLDLFIREFILISGQNPFIILSQISIANFKLKKNMPVSIVVDLRKIKMYSFLDRLINLVLPRIRDFQGLSCDSFDKFGNYSFSILGLEAFPELDLSRPKIKNGFTLTFSIKKLGSICTKEESLFLLQSLGLPFKNFS